MPDISTTNWPLEPIHWDRTTLSSHTRSGLGSAPGGVTLRRGNEITPDRGFLDSYAGGEFPDALAGALADHIGVTVGSTAIVSTISGMYFVTAALISIAVLGEPLSLNKVAGTGLALVAIVVINQ